MAVRLLFPLSQNDRVQPYWDFVDDLFYPGMQLRRRRQNEINGDWNRLLRELLQLNESSTANRAKTTDNNPVIVDGKFVYNLELSGINPQNIKVKTVGQTVVIDANQEDSNEEDGLKSYSKRQIHKTLPLPENVRPEDVTSALSRQGVLRITAPVLSLPAPEEKQVEIEIEHEKIEDQQNTADESTQ